MLPSTAMPNAPPNSAGLRDHRRHAGPLGRGGSDDQVVVKVAAGGTPTANTTHPITSTGRPRVECTRSAARSRPQPAPARRRSPTPDGPGASRGAGIDPTTNPRTDGASQRPVCSATARPPAAGTARRKGQCPNSTRARPLRPGPTPPSAPSAGPATRRAFRAAITGNPASAPGVIRPRPPAGGLTNGRAGGRTARCWSVMRPCDSSRGGRARELVG
jgi:hypothetical protein